MHNLIEKGSFVARDELWFYRKVRESDLKDFHPYLKKFYKEHGYQNPPTYKRLEENYNTGLYNNSHVIFDSDGTLNACSIIHNISTPTYDNTNGYVSKCWGSELYLEGKRSTVAPTFTLSMWFNIYGGTHCFFEASLPFVYGKFIEYGFEPIKVKEDKDDWVVIYDRIINPDKLYKFGKVRENRFEYC